MSLETPAKTLRNGNRRGDQANAPRCHAHSKRTGLACRQPAMRGKRVCRFHGGKSPGAPKGTRNGAYRHGMRTREVLAQFRWLNLACRRFRLLQRYCDALRLGREAIPPPPLEDSVRQDIRAAFGRSGVGDQLRLHRQHRAIDQAPGAGIGEQRP